MDPKDLLEALRAAFAQDLADGVRVLEEGIVGLERADDPGARDERLREVFRAAHGLKGSARAAAQPAVERACHAMESLLGAARDAGRVLAREDFAALLAAVDALAETQRRLAAGGTPDEAALGAAERAIEGRLEPAATATATPTATATATATPTPTPTPTATAQRPRARVGAIRLASSRLDALAATGGALLLAAQQAEARPARVDEIAGALRKARVALRDPQGAPAALDAVRRAERDLGALRAQLFRDGRALAQGTRRLAAEVRALRLTPWVDATAGLDRLARDVADAERKDVELVVEGEGLELDRSVVDALRDPLAHLVRNAVGHGIEEPDAREAAGKPRRGRVTVRARVDAERVLVRIEDDGRGIDAAEVRAAAERLGIRAPADPAQLAELVFQPGFSTAREVTAVSGRGVGLDAVAETIRALRGTISVTSRPGAGATFDVSLPATLYGLRAVLAEDAGQVFAVPALDVERVVRVAADRVRTSDGRTVLLAGEPLPLAPLAHAAGLPGGAWESGARRLALVVAAAGRRAAFAVDDVLAERELSLEPLGRRLAGARVATGVAVLPGGDLAIVLGARELVAAAHGGALAAASPAPAAAARRRPRVLLADDAATTRALARSILESAGYEVVAAADGEQAWGALQAQGADAVVSDVEMPGLGGFELTRAIRASPRWAKLPVVLLTALASEADRRRGLEAGADHYLVKSAFDQRELLDALADLLGEEP
jgi:two-component system chemotaxis sensor kinase CheA